MMASMRSGVFRLNKAFNFNHNRQACRRWLSIYQSSKVSTRELLQAYHHVAQHDDLALIASMSSTLPLSNPKEIFANTELNLGDVSVVGFDHDYTLVSYKEELQHFIYEEACKYLTSRSQYPPEVAAFKFDPHFLIRGLCYDMESGIFAKLDSSNRVALDLVHQGRRRLSREEALEVIGTHQVSDAYRKKNMVPILDHFALAESCLLSDICHCLTVKDIAFHPAAVFDDVNTAIRYVHKSGIMHNQVMRFPERYIEPSPKLGDLLAKFRNSGKKTFLLSNSRFEYVNAGLTYAIGPHWRDLFDFISASAAKPKFYTGKAMFRKLEQDSDNVWRTSSQTVEHFNPGGVFIRGNLHDLLRITQWESGKVLYIGDNLRADLVEPAKSYGWYTGAIIRELHFEIEQQNTTSFQALNVRLQLLEEVMRHAQRTPSGVNNDVLNYLENERRILQQKLTQAFNNSFGSVFSSQHGAMTIFANSVNRYADLYTAELENFAYYDSNYRFYPRKRGLPHESPARLSMLNDLIRSGFDRDVKFSKIG